MKRKLKIITNLLLTAVFAAISASCSEDEPVQAIGVTFNKTTLALSVGEKETLTATVTPDNAADKTLTWSSSAPEVATVADGAVRAVAKGAATITAATANGRTATCAVTVDEPEGPRDIAVQDNASLTQEVFADQTQGKSNVTFTTTGAWTSLISENPASVTATGPHPKPSEADAPIAWISISPDHGDGAGDYTVVITLTPNLTGADRTAVITITCAGTKIAITVTQKVENEDGTTLSGITGECAWALTGDPGDYTLTISGNGAMGDHDYRGTPWYQYSDDIKTTVIQDGVKTIGNHAFEGIGLTSVVIGNSVTTIGNWAFDGCHSLTFIAIPNSVTTVGDAAFSSCSNLTSVTIPNSVITIGVAAFSNCQGLTSVTIGNSVTTIGDWAFIDCYSLSSVDIPTSVTTIGVAAFARCNLTSVTIGNSVATIGNGAFERCYSLTSIHVDFANTHYSSENGVLFNKDKTTLVAYPGGKTGSYVISNSVRTIGEYAFYYCDGLTSITIPNSVITIGEYAFFECRSLTSIHVDFANTHYSSENGVLFNKDRTTLVAYPGGKTGSYVIPNSITTIDRYAFCACRNLTSVTIPNSVITIGDHAFTSCISLVFVTNLRPAPQSISSDVFNSVNASCVLKVPASAVDAYKAAPVWREFGDRINPDMQAAFAWEVEGNFAEECVGVLYPWDITPAPALYYKYTLPKPGTLRIEFEDSHIHTFLHDREPGYYAKTATLPALTFADQPTVPTNGGNAWDVVMSADLNGKSGNVNVLCPRSTPQDISFHLLAGIYWSTHTLEINTTRPDCQMDGATVFDAYEEDFVLKVTFTPDEE
jgi:hypothetical protein